MTEVAKLLEGLAAVAWPAIIILLIFLFRPAVAALIESARSRKFTLKLGGQELTMEEANEQQRSLIADLQKQVLEIRKAIEGDGHLTKAAAGETGAAPGPAVNSVLWVDDKPKNNSYFVQQLADQRINVDLALSTAEGLRLFDKKTYGVVISDMGRTENGEYRATAGLELLKEIRNRNATLPFFIFCTSRGVHQHKEAAMQLGVTAITSSATEMSGILQNTVSAVEA